MLRRTNITRIATSVLALALAFPGSASALCGKVEIHAHRGSQSFPENGLKALMASLDEGADAVEFDVQRLRTGEWVVHHDPLTGRVVSGAVAPAGKLTAAQWRTLTLTGRDGAPSRERPPFLEDVLDAFAARPRAGQMLNVEAKGIYGCQALESLHGQISARLGSDRYMMTSTDPKALSCLRNLDPDLRLGLVITPSEASLEKISKGGMSLGGALEAAQRMGAGALVKNARQVLAAQSTERHLDGAGLDALKSSVGAPLGIHFDIETLQRDPSLIERARDRGLYALTYALDPGDTRQVALLRGSRSSQGLTGIIIDSNPKSACQEVKP
jgi:glycerophosphoryl diester phosphodiesterase